MAEKMFKEILPTLPPEPLEDFDNKIDYPTDYRFEKLPSLDEIVDHSRDLIRMPIDQDPEPPSFPPKEEESRAAEGCIRKSGIEILAFYKSYRFKDNKPFKGDWGIFFINAGVQHLTHLIQLDFPHLLAVARKVAIDFLWAHEVFHAKFDVGVLGMEALAKKHFYIPQKNAFRNFKLHEPEEAIANKRAWTYAKEFERNELKMDRSSHTKGISDFFYDFMKRQPGAYSRFDEDEYDLKNEIAAGIFTGHRYPRAKCNGLAHWVGLVPRQSCTRNSIPQHLVLSVKYSRLISPLRFFPKVTKVNETTKFQLKLDPSLKKLWENTKSKLIAAPERGSLDFKEWPPKPPLWSVKMNKGFRAHLNPIAINEGVWEAVECGTHDQMGH